MSLQGITKEVTVEKYGDFELTKSSNKYKLSYLGAIIDTTDQFEELYGSLYAWVKHFQMECYSEYKKVARIMQKLDEFLTKVDEMTYQTIPELKLLPPLEGFRWIDGFRDAEIGRPHRESGEEYADGYRRAIELQENASAKTERD